MAFLYGDGSRICCALGDIKEGSCHLSAAPYPCKRFVGRLQLALWHHPSWRGKAIWKDLLMPCGDSFILFTEMINYEALWDFMSQSSSPNPWFPSSLAADILYIRNNKKSHSIVKVCAYLYYAYMVLTKIYICLKWIGKADTFFFIKRGSFCFPLLMFLLLFGFLLVLFPFVHGR